MQFIHIKVFICLYRRRQLLPIKLSKQLLSCYEQLLFRLCMYIQPKELLGIRVYEFRKIGLFSSI